MHVEGAIFCCLLAASGGIFRARTLLCHSKRCHRKHELEHAKLNRRDQQEHWQSCRVDITCQDVHLPDGRAVKVPAIGPATYTPCHILTHDKLMTWLSLQSLNPEVGTNLAPERKTFTDVPCWRNDLSARTFASSDSRLTPVI